MSIPTERNTSLKTIKLTKYKDLQIEIEKTTIVPVIIGALKLFKKGTENYHDYIGKILGNIRIGELQQTVLLGTANKLRRTLSIKYSIRLMRTV